VPAVSGYRYVIIFFCAPTQYNLDVSPMLAIFHDVYEKKYPRHPYTSLLQSYEQTAAIRTGNPCPDVAALDTGTGKEVRLSELIICGRRGAALAGITAER
jgi:hypothetical protein